MATPLIHELQPRREARNVRIMVVRFINMKVLYACLTVLVRVDWFFC